MTLLPRGVKVHLAFGFIDMRKGIDGLAMLVQGIPSRAISLCSAPQCQHRERRQHARPREPPDRTSRPESPAIARMPDQRGCNGNLSASLLNHLMNIDQASGPRMPRIKKLDSTIPWAFRRRVVQWGPHASIPGERCTDLARRRSRRAHSLCPNPGRTESPICPDLIYDRHSRHRLYPGCTFAVWQLLGLEQRKTPPWRQSPARLLDAHR
jgi:hypothetical protein